MSLSVVVWKWSVGGVSLFGPEYVNVMRSMLDRHLHIPHKLYCVTDNPTGIDGDVQIVPLEWFRDTPRCRRRMVQYAEWWTHWVGPRFLMLDLDVVLTGDVTSLFNVPDPVKLWKVGYANVYSGSVQLMDTGILHTLYQMYCSDPDRLPKLAQPRGVGSDQAMLNYYFAHVLEGFDVPHWTEGDGIHTFFGTGYGRYAHLGVSMASDRLPEGSRIVVLGSEDKWILDSQALPCLAAHWR